MNETLLKQWLVAVEAHMQGFFGTDYKLSLDHGRKYIRVVKTCMRSDVLPDRSVFCFIDPTTGAIYKAAGWKAPAKGIRGYITDPNFSIGRGVTQFGGSYAR